MNTHSQHLAAPASRWWALATVAAAQFLAVVDAFIVNVAVPSIRADLHAGAAEIQAIIAVYQIAYAALMKIPIINCSFESAASVSSSQGLSASPWLRCGADCRDRRRS